MNWSLIVLTATMLFSANVLAKGPNLSGNELIYGEDDRYEAQNFYDSRFVELSRSVAVRVPGKRLTIDRDDPQKIHFTKRLLMHTIPQLCSTERFAKQVSLGDCSGFLIAPDKLVTAGHCMDSSVACSEAQWVFDFYEDAETFDKNNVYSCKQILLQKLVNSEDEISDYAVIELDRKVINREPLKRRKMGRVNINTPLVVIGHPLGLPKKIIDGARVSRMNDIERERKFHSWLMRANYFTANVDAYMGSSGSPVINRKTGKVEGILIQGAEDFEYNAQKKCLQSVHLSNSHLNTYEKVMRINMIPGL